MSPTRSPRSAKALAAARPTPAEAPVTTTTLLMVAGEYPHSWARKPRAPASTRKAGTERSTFDRFWRALGLSSLLPPGPPVCRERRRGTRIPHRGGDDSGQGPRIQRQERQAVRGSSQEGHEQGARRQDLQHVRGFEEGWKEADRR